ncbi:MAG: helix-turn-helix domain-containing protein [Deltaproteobacteria bacterium]|nr:helix-turn-helix domain-containing protein [Deltaproteobacteria bacterium]
MEKKRDIGAEVIQGLGEIREFYAGKMTLRTHEVVPAKIDPVTPKELKETREKLNMSQAVFAARLGLNKRTLERWERGDATPSDSTSILIRLAARFDDTLERIQAVAAAPSKSR